MTNVMVSYSRKDSAIARRLIDEFKKIELDVWVDWEDIPPAVGWLGQILRGIEESDAFIFLVSPDSIKSEICMEEVEHAAKNNKRIIPIVVRPVEPKEVTELIRDLNWIFLRDTDVFEEGIAKVKVAITLDIEWVQEHRKLQLDALNWERGKDASTLLRGRELRTTVQMVKAAVTKDPKPTELQRRYLELSRRAEISRITLWIAIGLAVLIMIILSLTALQQSRLAQENERRANANAVQAVANQRVAEQNEQKARREQEIAQEQRILAEAQRGVSRAQIYQSRVGQLDISTLLAIDSWQRLPSQEAGDILRKNISLLPIPVKQVAQLDRINALEFSPDGNTFLTASADNTVCVWRVEDGSQLFCRATSGSVNDAAFGPLGDFIVAGNESGDVLILDAATGEFENEFPLGVAVSSVDVSPDGRYLAASRDDGKTDFYNLQTREFAFQFATQGSIRVSAFSPNGRWFAAGTDIGSVTIWPMGGAQPYSASGHRGEVLALTFSPDNNLIVTGGADTAVFVNQVSTGQEFHRIPSEDWVKDIAFSPDGSWFVTVSNDHRVRVWDSNTAKERIRMLQDSLVEDVQVSANGKWIATTGLDKTIRVWNAATGAEIFQIPLDSSGTVLAFSADENHLVSGDASGQITIWDISDIPAPMSFLQFDGLTGDLHFDPLGNLLAVSDANRAWLLDAGQLAALTSLPPAPLRRLEGNVSDLIISPDANWLAISTETGEVILRNLAAGTERRIMQSNFEVRIAFSSDGQTLFTGRYDRVVQAWDAGTGESVGEFSLGTSSSPMSMAASGDRLAVGLLDKLILMDSVTGEIVAELPSLGGHPLVAFSPDGSLLASSNTNDQINLWRREGGEYVPLKSIASEDIYSMTFSPQGDRLVVGVKDAVYFFDPLSGASLARIPHNDAVNGLAFTPDGAVLATSSLRVVQFWDMESLQIITDDELIAAACSRLLRNFDEAQWSAFFEDEPYRPLCPNLEVPK